MTALDEVDFERLSERARWTYDNVAMPMAEHDLTQEEIAEKLGLTRRQISQWRDQLAEEMRAQQEGAVVPETKPGTEDYEAIKESIIELGQLDPILMHGEVVLDGNTRLKICEELGLEPWKVQVVDVPDMRKAGLALNCARRHLTSAQKRRLAMAEVLYDPSRSDRSIAALLGVSHPLVGDVRKELEATGVVESLTTRQDSQGREQPVGPDKVEYPIRIDQIVRNQITAGQVGIVGILVSGPMLSELAEEKVFDCKSFQFRKIRDHDNLYDIEFTT
jgi:ParB-like chromosome segregation protein Spo0J